MDNKRTRKPIELIENKVYLLGDMISIDNRVPWVPPYIQGYENSNAYLLLESNTALLVNVGLGCHKELLVEQLHNVIDDSKSLSILFTKIEVDSFVNVEFISKYFCIDTLYCPASLNQFQFLCEKLDIIPKRMLPGDTIEPGSTRNLTLFEGPICVLPSHWPYDSESKMLFTSDCFGYFYSEVETEQTIISSPQKVSTQLVKDYLLIVYPWLEAIEPPAIELIINRLESIDCKNDIQYLAPAHGGIVAGDVVVKEQFQIMKNALSSAFK